MDVTISVSKGVFPFKNEFKRNKISSKPGRLHTASHAISRNLWYQQNHNLWSQISKQIDQITQEMFTLRTTGLLCFIKNSCHLQNEIKTAILITGINMPDHDIQFKALEKQIRTEITPYVACLYSQDCNNLKYLMENMISQFIYKDVDDSADDYRNGQGLDIKKNNLNLPLLQSWYESINKNTSEKQKNPLVIIIPDFEGFNVSVLQKFILIVSSYINRLPFVFLFGIATSLTSLYNLFPYHVTSKMSIEVFKCQLSSVHLNMILENVFLNPNCAFQLGGKVFNLFGDIFLFYDFSVNNFIQNIKYAAMEHFEYGNGISLCTLDKYELQDLITNQFDHEDFENVRQIFSFRKLVENESPKNKIKLLTDDDYFGQVLYEKVYDLQKYIKRFHIFLRCLHVLVRDLPGHPLGQQIREIYAVAVSNNITKSVEYMECFKLLSFQSKEEFCTKLRKITDILGCYLNERSKVTKLKEFQNELKMFLYELDNIKLVEPNSQEPNGKVHLAKSTDRKALKQVLFLKAKEKPKLDRYDIIRREVLACLSQNFEVYLLEPSSFCFHEIFFFDDLSIQNNITGVQRSAIHNALNDPHSYLQCSCCETKNNSLIKACMPDICIAYKLHLECGKIINLYDWLQAFLSILDPIENDEEEEGLEKVVDPSLQARFTQAVTELEFLGFIKSSKRKLDHVSRLTWGG
ncbi:origin recognition complex subunit 3 [Cylas formicarius]|uniref:origin recognition complex subunit 3 n=1 Tax=Cylas formicarius TaxID=197179 RepID=UPI0029587DD2|nr:origin recognition complex subunit 3 [Cylas formicarius]XP_060518940.1 origin recognition complex subunit 3 [Cylas formicarius]